MPVNSFPPYDHKSPLGKARGLTLIELLVVLTISSILAAIAIPAFTTTLASSRTSNGANALIAALDLARSEAIRLGLPVSVCAAVDPNALAPVCKTGAGVDWSDGFVVWTESQAPGAVLGVVDAGEAAPTYRQQAFSSGSGPRAVTIGSVSSITYLPTGLRGGAGLAAATFNISSREPSAPASSGKSPRCLTVSVVGQYSVVQTTCP